MSETPQRRETADETVSPFPSLLESRKRLTPEPAQPDSDEQVDTGGEIEAADSEPSRDGVFAKSKAAMRKLLPRRRNRDEHHSDVPQEPVELPEVRLVPVKRRIQVVTARPADSEEAQAEQVPDPQSEVLDGSSNPPPAVDASSMPAQPPQAAVPPPSAAPESAVETAPAAPAEPAAVPNGREASTEVDDTAGDPAPDVSARGVAAVVPQPAASASSDAASAGTDETGDVPTATPETEVDAGLEPAAEAPPAPQPEATETTATVDAASTSAAEAVAAETAEPAADSVAADDPAAAETAASAAPADPVPAVEPRQEATTVAEPAATETSAPAENATDPAAAEAPAPAPAAAAKAAESPELEHRRAMRAVADANQVERWAVDISSLERLGSYLRGTAHREETAERSAAASEPTGGVSEALADSAPEAQASAGFEWPPAPPAEPSPWGPHVAGATATAEAAPLPSRTDAVTAGTQSELPRWPLPAASFSGPPVPEDRKVEGTAAPVWKSMSPSRSLAPTSASGLAPGAAEPPKFTLTDEDLRPPAVRRRRRLLAVVAIVAVLALLAALFVLWAMGDSAAQKINVGHEPMPDTYTGEPADVDATPLPDPAADVEGLSSGFFRMETSGAEDCAGPRQVEDDTGARLEWALVDCDSDAAQIEVTDVGGGRYLLSLHPDVAVEPFGGCLAPAELGPSEGFRDAPCGAKTREHFYLDGVSESVFRVRPAVSDYCMSVDGDVVVQDACRANTTSQEFEFSSVHS